MKSIIQTLILLVGLSAARAQGTLQYFANLDGSTAVPFNANYSWLGLGQFTLSDNTLSFNIVFSTFSADFDQGRLIGLSTTPVLSLGQAYRVAPDPLSGFSGSTSWSGTFAFTPQERTEFLGGGISIGLMPTRLFGDPNPIGEIVGAIQPVPEPSTWALLLTGGFFFWWYERKKRMA